MPLDFHPPRLREVLEEVGGQQVAQVVIGIFDFGFLISIESDMATPNGN